MELTNPVSMTTVLWLLAGLTMATRTGARGRSDHYHRSRPERFENRIREPPRMFARPLPFQPGSVLDSWRGVGRRPFPEIPIKKPVLPMEQDPADLSNIFGHCSKDPGMNMQSVFSGMFLSSTDLEELVLDTEAEMQPFTLDGRQHRKNNRYVEENRFQQTIGTVQDRAAPGESARNTCCETKLVITAPGKVVVEGQSMAVVHMNHSYQYVQEGLCKSPNSRCRDIGRCTQMYKYAFLLLYDPKLVGRINPPVRYGRVQIKSHCECMNIGSGPLP